MIYTVTLNPSLDYIIEVNDFEFGMTNRASSECLYPGGKGINVSIVLKNLGFNCTSLGFIAGFVGDEIVRKVSEFGCLSNFIRCNEGNSRINVKIKNIDGTEINGIGPKIDESKVQELMEQLKQVVKGDVVVLAGSIPASLSSTIYQEMMAALIDKEIDVVVDATKDLLLNVLSYRPFLIKPNNHELGEIFNATITTREEVVPYAKKLQEQGARNVLVSMSSKGAVLVAENGEIYESDAPKGELINAVGAGDSMVAGFIAGWLETKNYKQAFIKGLATGSASAFSEALATKKEVENIVNQLTSKGEK